MFAHKRLVINTKLCQMKKAFYFFSLLIIVSGGCHRTTRQYDDYLNNGLKKERNKDYQGAIEDYTRAINIDPKSGLAFYNRGVVKYEIKDYYGAIADYTNAIAISPHGVAYFNRGLANIKIGQKESACLDFSMASDCGLSLADKAKKIYCQ